jgi:tetratricopeptide (TPR) repeat protein
LFRANAGGHHWTNVVFHLVNTLLLFYVLRLMTGTLWRSACVAALFAVHPMNVESVAWVAERKNVLSTCLGFLTLLLYAFYIRKPGWRRYLPVLTVFTLGLMAKSMLVTLPFLMLLLDLWPLRRFPIHPLAEDARCLTDGSQQAPILPISVSGLLLEKIPLLVMASGSIALTLLAAQRGGVMATFTHFPMTVRLANSLHAYAAYIGKLFWPQDLAVFYPHPGTLLLWQTILSGLLITSVTALILKQSRSRPYLLVGWFWFLGTLVPVIGLVQVGLQAMADRYAYLPFIGLFIMLVWGAEDLSGLPRQGSRIAVIFLFTLLILAAGLFTRHQLRFWESSRSLFLHALSVTEQNDVAHSNLARAIFEEGDWEGAVAHYREAIRINPRLANHYNNLGAVMAHQRKIDEAIGQYRMTLLLDPRHVGALLNMGLAMESLGRLTEADAFYEAVIREEPDHVYAHRQRAMVAMKKGRYEEAVAHFQAALHILPGDQELIEALFRVMERKSRQQKILDR